MKTALMVRDNLLDKGDTKMFKTGFSTKVAAISFILILLSGAIHLVGSEALDSRTCWAASTCEGDFDFDGDVDGSDLALFAADFGRTDCVDDCAGDFDTDGDVDGSDLAVFAADFGRTDCTGTLRISHATCVTASWDWDLFLCAEVLDQSDAVIPNASVWVIGADNNRVELEYDPALKIYHQKRYLPIVLGDYTFHAELGGEAATPVTKSLSSTEKLDPVMLTACPSAEPGESLTMEWTPVAGVQGYFVAVANETTGEQVWSNAESLFDSLALDTSVTVPPDITEAGTSYGIYIFGANGASLESASAMSGNKFDFTPGESFNMETSCVATNTPLGKFICLHVYLEDCFGEDIEGAQVWAIYPSGKQVPFVHDINGWYKTTDPPDPQLDETYGTYTFFAEYDGKQMSTARALTNYFLPIPTNVAVNPDPPVRGDPFTVTWDPVPGATTYCIDLYERPSHKQLYHTCTDTPSHTVPAWIWDHLTSGNEYEMLTHSMDAEQHSDASAESFVTIEFTAP